MKFFLETFGCQANDLESSYLSGLLAKAGWVEVDEWEGADWVLLNTCSVRQHAEEKVTSRLGRLGEWKKGSPARRIGVLGCMAVEHHANLLKRFPDVDLVAGPDRYAALPGAMAGIREAQVWTGFDPAAFPSNPEGARGPRAFVEIMKGCDNHCAYCIVPTVRGAEVSRPLPDILGEVTRLAAGGVKEVTLLGQNVNSYRDGAVRFPELLARVGSAEGLSRVRFFTSHPKDLSDELIEVMASVPAVCEYLHLPVQSGSDAVLRRMNRRYTSGYYRELVARLKAFVPEVALTTDLIVGFPGETDADFEATLALLSDIRFDSVFSFKYSPRPGTPAASLGDPVPEEVKEARLKRLNDLAWDHAAERHRARIGRVEEVMVEGPADRTPGAFFGKTRQNKTAVFPAGDRCLSPGDLVQVRMEENRVACLYGRIES